MIITPPKSWPDRLAWILVALASLAYAVMAVREALDAPYWMDEVLAVWTARLPTAGAVWAALNKGAEFSPPLFHLILQKIQQVGGHGRLAMRAPALVAVYVVAVCAFILVRRRREPMLAALAFTVCLASGLVDYAVQARQYALVAACFALAAVLWDGIPARRRAWPSAVGLGLLLAFAIGLHFYAILLAGTLGLVELAWAVKHRQLRWPVLAAIALAGLSILIWWPIFQHVSAFNRGDTASPYYYAHPTPMKVADAYVGILAGHDATLASPLILVLVAALAAFVLSLRTPWRISDLDLLIIAACLIPGVVYAFAVLVTHTFNERYAIAAALGFALLMARAVAALPQSRWVALGLGLVLLLGMLAPIRMSYLADDLREDTALVRRAPTGLPIVTGNGLRFLELSENAGPGVARRLVYLTADDEAALGDPTNEHQVERWKSIDPKLNVQIGAAFFAAHKSFVMFRDPQQAAEVAKLIPADAKVEVIGRYDTATLSRVTLAP